MKYGESDGASDTIRVGAQDVADDGRIFFSGLYVNHSWAFSQHCGVNCGGDGLIVNTLLWLLD